jgi:ABC-2 type transport system permease protein
MLNTIYVLWHRQLIRYWRSRMRMISSFGQPLLFLVALYFGFGPIYQKASGGSYLAILAPGIVAMNIIFTGMFSGMEVIWDRQFGFLKETLVAPVSRASIIIGRTLGGATVAFLQGLVVFGVTYLVGFRPINNLMIPLAMVFMILISLMFTALGTAIATKMEDMHAFPIIMNFLVMPLFFFSGALFPLEGLPPSIRFIAHLNPLSYGVDGLRGTLTGISHFGILLDGLVLAGCITLFFAIGAFLFSKIEI